MPKLTDPIRLGAIEAKNRILMSPLTRARATRDHVPTPLIAEYYAQRASCGLIVSEATGVSQQGLGWPYTPGIWNEAQVEAWKPITAAVHAAGGRIAIQLWHMGRVVHPSFLGGESPVSSSRTTAPGHAHTYDGKQPYAEARPLTIDEIMRTVADYARGAANAIRAGFDGIQLHGANGYLIDQFLRDNANLRDDDYGGSIENRIRFMSEICEAIAAEIGADKIGIRLSPTGMLQGVEDSDPHPLFLAAAARLHDIGIGWLELRESRLKDDDVAHIPPVYPHIRSVFGGPVVLNTNFDAVSAQAALDRGDADAISFGRAFISNPDLPRRMAEGLPLTKAHSATFYTQDGIGYTDYPAWSDANQMA